MTAYVKLTDYAVKDALLSGNPSKLVRGTELDAEFNAIAAADALNLKTADGVTRVAEQNATHITLGSVSGDTTITATASPTLTAYVAGQTFRFVATGTNTGAVTINIDGLGAKSITKDVLTPLAAGDIDSGQVVQITYDGTRFQLLSSSASGGAGATGASGDNVFIENDLNVATSYRLGDNSLTTCTISIATPAVITQVNSYVAGQAVQFTTTGSLPTGLSTNTVYYVISTGLSTSSFQVSTSVGGSAVVTSGTQSGTHKCGKLKNAVTGGPVTLLDGVSVTVPTGAAWTIV